MIKKFILVVLMVLVTSVGFAQPNIGKPPPGSRPDRGHPLSQNLMAWYMFNEGAGYTLLDVSGNAHHGTLENIDATEWVGSIHGGGLNFDDSDNRVSIPTIQTMTAGGTTYGGPISVSVWAISNAYPSVRDGLVCGNNSSGSSGYGLRIEDNTNPSPGAIFFVNGWQDNVAIFAEADISLLHW